MYDINIFISELLVLLSYFLFLNSLNEKQHIFENVGIITYSNNSLLRSIPE